MPEKKPLIVYFGPVRAQFWDLYRDDFVFLEHASDVFDLLKKQKVDLVCCEMSSGSGKGSMPAVSLLQEVSRLSPGTRLALTGFIFQFKSGAEDLKKAIPPEIKVFWSKYYLPKFIEYIRQVSSGKVPPLKRIPEGAWPKELNPLKHTTGSKGDLVEVAIELLAQAPTQTEKKKIKRRLRAGWRPSKVRQQAWVDDHLTKSGGVLSDKQAGWLYRVTEFNRALWVPNYKKENAKKPQSPRQQQPKRPK
ncbi:MAG: hypothetical protein NT067_01000 [Candidatus Diapherotrites archaeon]|nr:hypothetical protein [Candidatus Diapherotrites archaeon]